MRASVASSRSCASRSPDLIACAWSRRASSCGWVRALGSGRPARTGNDLGRPHRAPRTGGACARRPARTSGISASSISIPIAPSTLLAIAANPSTAMDRSAWRRRAHRCRGLLGGGACNCRSATRFALPEQRSALTAPCLQARCPDMRGRRPSPASPKCPYRVEQLQQASEPGISVSRPALCPTLPAGFRDTSPERYGLLVGRRARPSPTPEPSFGRKRGSWHADVMRAACMPTVPG